MNKLFEFLIRLPARINGRIQSRIVPSLLEWKVTIGFLWPRKAKPHGLPSTLIISLTSYPARFGKLHLTLKCLLSQTMTSDKVILWVAHQDKDALTPAILKLQQSGLEIAYCDDLRSYKKIIPSLKRYPESFIVTADDDMYYWPTWLEELVYTYKIDSKHVITHRAHHIRLGADNFPLPYSQWEYETQRKDASPLNFQTGIGGVLYPPNVFHSEVLNEEAFKSLCPQADDVWLYWMMRLNGKVVRKTKYYHSLYCWTGTQEVALSQDNGAGGGNDVQIDAIYKVYGNAIFYLNQE